jgi:hypothetical protein
MRKFTFISLLVVSTLAAVAVAWLWALAPVNTPFNWDGPPAWKGEAALVKSIWHFRLIPPEWGNTSLDYFRWCLVETCARLAVVFLGWCVTLKLIEHEHDCGGSEGEAMKYFMLIVAGGVLGGIATLIYAFRFDNVPTTNNGVNGVLAGAMPIGVVCGGMAGALIAHRWHKPKHP